MFQIYKLRHGYYRKQQVLIQIYWNKLGKYINWRAKKLGLRKQIIQGFIKKIKKEGEINIPARLWKKNVDLGFRIRVWKVCKENG